MSRPARARGLKLSGYGCKERAEYGRNLIARLSVDLSDRFGRGFSSDNLESMRIFYRAFPSAKISETLSRKSKSVVIQEVLSAGELLTPKTPDYTIGPAIPNKEGLADDGHGA